MRAVLRLAAAAVLLAVPAAAQPQAGGSGSLSRMLGAVPAPTSAQQLMSTETMAAYAWLGPLPGAPGHALDFERYRDLKASAPLAFGLVWPTGLASSVMLNAPSWPSLIGFDAKAVNAMLIAPFVGRLPTDPLLVLAGGPSLHNADRIGAVLDGRGFKREDRDGTPLFSIGEDGSINFRRRNPIDPFDGGLGRAQRIAVAPEALLEAASTATVAGALDVLAGRTPSLADTDAVRGLLAALPDTEVTQAVILSPLANFALTEPIGSPLLPSTRPPVSPFGPYAPPADPPLPTWTMAAIAELTSPPGMVRQRLVLAVIDPEAARAAMTARIEAARTGPAPIPVQSVAMRVLPERFGNLGVLVVDMALGPPSAFNNTPMYRWRLEASRGFQTPLTVRMAGPGQPGGRQP